MSLPWTLQRSLNESAIFRRGTMTQLSYWKGHKDLRTETTWEKHTKNKMPNHDKNQSENILEQTKEVENKFTISKTRASKDQNYVNINNSQQLSSVKYQVKMKLSKCSKGGIRKSIVKQQSPGWAATTIFLLLKRKTRQHFVKNFTLWR